MHRNHFDLDTKIGELNLDQPRQCFQRLGRKTFSCGCGGSSKRKAGNSESAGASNS